MVLIEGQYLVSRFWERDFSRSPPPSLHEKHNSAIDSLSGYCLFCDSTRQVSVFLDKSNEAIVVLYRDNMETCPIYWVDRAETGQVPLLAEDAPLPLCTLGKDATDQLVAVSCLPVLETSKSFGVAFSTIWDKVFQTAPDVNSSILSKVRLGSGDSYTIHITYPDERIELLEFKSFSFRMGAA